MDDETAEEAPAKKEKPVFPGFNTTFKGYSQLPNDWLDEITSQIDNVAELKIVLYVYRHTWGFQKKSDNPDEPAKHDEIKKLTTDEFMHGRKKSDGTRMDRGTGLSKHSVIDGTRNAIKHGYILEEVDDRDKGRVIKSYALKMLKTDENSCANSAPQECKDCTPDVKDLHSSGANSSHRSEKDTSETTRRKERKKESAGSHVTEDGSTSDNVDAPFIHSFNLPQESLNKIRKFADMYGDTNVEGCLLEAEQIFQDSGVSDEAFCTALIDARGLVIGRNKSMSKLFKQLRGILKVTK